MRAAPNAPGPLPKRLECTLAVIDKRRTSPNVAEVMHLIGDVRNKTAIILDDMVDTAGTLTQAAKALKENGATAVYACATHGVLSGPAIERINNSDIAEIVLTDTIPLGDKESMTKDHDAVRVGTFWRKPSGASMRTNPSARYLYRVLCMFESLIQDTK